MRCRYRSHLRPLCLCPSPQQGGDCVITGKNDADDFLCLLAAMEILHFSPEDQSAIFRVLSSILHLGNVYFQRHEVKFLKWFICSFLLHQFNHCSSTYGVYVRTQVMRKKGLKIEKKMTVVIKNWSIPSSTGDVFALS